jgi:ATP-dependent Clp protease protease subunit
MMQMLYLENQRRNQEISLYINSPGGAVDDTLALYDTMRFLSSPIATFCIGRAYSGGAVLLTAGTRASGGSSCRTPR